MSKCNGFHQVTTGSEYRLSASRMCIMSEGNINFVGSVMISGGLSKGSSVASAAFLSAILSGNWASITASILKSCK